MQADPITAERDTTIREDGNAAHWLALELHARRNVSIGAKAPNGVFITADMIEHVRDYLSAIDCSPNMYNHFEWSYSLTGPTWQINGRADHIGLVWNECLIINDFKYGYTIVEPEKNWTLISHAIGYCVTNNVRPARIVFTIHQPRAPHREGRERQWEISFDELWNHYYMAIWGILGNLSDELQTGPHCHRCPSFLSCPARQDAELSAIEVAHMAYNASIDDFDLSDRLQLIERADALLKQAKKAYEEEAIHRISKGKVIRLYAMDDDLGNRIFQKHVTPELVQAFTGRADLVKPAELISPRQMEQAGVNEDIVKALTYRPMKGKKLVKINPNKKGEKLFGKR